MNGERNWAGNLEYRAERVARPTSFDELREIVRAGGPLRAVGTRHSFNAIADTTGTLVSLADMPREIDVRDGFVRISGGVRYGDVAPALEAEGRALANLASLPHISVAGAIATGTHGSGDAIPSLAAAARSVTFLTAAGDEVTLSRGDADFGGAAVHLGALGVVTEVELDTEPTYEVEQHVFDAPRWDAILADYDAVTSLGDSVSLFTTWRSAETADQLWVKRRASRGPFDAGGAERLGATAADGPRHPIAGVDPAACNEQGGVAGPWLDRLPHFRLDFTPSVGEELQSEFLLPREHAADAIRAVLAIADAISPLLFVCEIRTVAGDETWLSPSSHRDSIALHFTWHRDEQAVRGVLPTLEAALVPFAARPHWGKVFTTPGADVAALYPRLDDFRELRRAMDPDDRFQNDFTRALGL